VLLISSCNDSFYQDTKYTLQLNEWLSHSNSHCLYEKMLHKEENNPIRKKKYFFPFNILTKLKQRRLLKKKMRHQYETFYDFFCHANQHFRFPKWFITRRLIKKNRICRHCGMNHTCFKLRHKKGVFVKHMKPCVSLKEDHPCSFSTLYKESVCDLQESISSWETKTFGSVMSKKNNLKHTLYKNIKDNGKEDKKNWRSIYYEAFIQLFFLSHTTRSRKYRLFQIQFFCLLFFSCITLIGLLGYQKKFNRFDMTIVDIQRFYSKNKPWNATLPFYQQMSLLTFPSCFHTPKRVTLGELVMHQFFQTSDFKHIFFNISQVTSETDSCLLPEFLWTGLNYSLNHEEYRFSLSSHRKSDVYPNLCQTTNISTLKLPLIHTSFLSSSRAPFHKAMILPNMSYSIKHSLQHSVNSCILLSPLMAFLLSLCSLTKPSFCSCDTQFLQPIFYPIFSSFNESNPILYLKQGRNDLENFLNCMVRTFGLKIFYTSHHYSLNNFQKDYIYLFQTKPKHFQHISVFEKCTLCYPLINTTLPTIVSEIHTKMSQDITNVSFFLNTPHSYEFFQWHHHLLIIPSCDIQCLLYHLKPLFSFHFRIKQHIQSLIQKFSNINKIFKPLNWIKKEMLGNISFSFKICFFFDHFPSYYSIQYCLKNVIQFLLFYLSTIYFLFKGYFTKDFNFLIRVCYQSFDLISPNSFLNTFLVSIFSSYWVYLVLLLVWCPSIVSPHPLTLVHIPRLMVYIFINIYRYIVLYKISNCVTYYFCKSSSSFVDFSDHIVLYMSILLILSIEIVAAERTHCFTLHQQNTYTFPPPNLSNMSSDKRKHVTLSAFQNNTSKNYFSSYWTSFLSIIFTRQSFSYAVQNISYLIKWISYPLLFVYIFSLILIVCLSYISFHTAFFFHTPRETFYGIIVAFLGLYVPFWIVIQLDVVSLDKLGILRHPLQPKLPLKTHIHHKKPFPSSHILRPKYFAH
jgi:hypothetical protein